MNWKVRVPCSTANLGSGFDVLGLALQMHLEVEVTQQETGGLTIVNKGEGAEELPTDETNMIYKLVSLYAGDKLPKNVRFEITNGIPLTRGYGSSAAATVAGVALGQWIAGGEIPGKQLVLNAAAKEEGHPDNVAPSVLGGLTISAMQDGEVLSGQFPWPEGVHITAIIPAYEMSTQAARRALPEKVPYGDAIFNLQRFGILLSGLFLGKKDWLKFGVNDRLHQDYRFPLLPGMKEAVDTLNEQPDCLGSFISGAGPGAIALANGNGHKLGEMAVKCFEEAGFEATFRMLAVDTDGLQFLSA